MMVVGFSITYMLHNHYNTHTIISIMVHRHQMVIKTLSTRMGQRRLTQSLVNQKTREIVTTQPNQMIRTTANETAKQ